MFTGLVEGIGRVTSVRSGAGGLSLSIDLGRLAQGVKAGDSICISGACLTLSRMAQTEASFDVIAETVRASTLALLKVADQVNLERAMPADGRFGGHIVQGHVDGVGTVERIDKAGGEHTIWITGEQELMGLMVDKGSVAIDGVSLTIVKSEPKRFSVSLIPTTLRETTISQCRTGDKVNIEADLLSKWIKKQLEAMLSAGRGGKSPITVEQLRQQGYS